MNISANPKKLLYLVLGCGILGLELRYVLYTAGQDSQGLLVSNHWSMVLLWTLSVLTLLGLWYLTRQIEGPVSYQRSFPVSGLAGAGSLLAAAAVLISTLKSGGSAVGTILGILAAAALVLTGLCRMFGFVSNALLYGLLCVYFAGRMVTQYQSWSADPQMIDYCFHLFACVSLMLSSYQLGAFDAGLGNHRRLWFWSLLSVYLCCICMVGPGGSLFYPACALWLLSNLSCLNPRRRRPKMGGQSL